MPTIVARRYDTLQCSRRGNRGAESSAEFGRRPKHPDLPIVAPGLVDLQINGFAGVEFNDPELTLEKVLQVALSQDAFGVAAFLATCTTDSHDVLKHALATIARAIHDLPEVAARHSRHSLGGTLHLSG